jgi:hypothetical protein
MSWVITGTQKTDPDALAYLAEVERADGQALESGVRDAVIAFVVGCKSDGIWTAIKASCILAGARTLNGALVPLVGTAPTSFNFVAGDYNRKTGLVGNASNKRINSNRSLTDDSPTNHHLSVFTTAADTTSTSQYIGATSPGFTGNFVGVSSGEHFYRSSASAGTFPPAQASTGFFGARRILSTEFNWRGAGSSGVFSSASAILNSQNIQVFCRSRENVVENFSNARLAFYSIGESLDLALLDARVTTLVNAFAAAIP